MATDPQTPKKQGNAYCPTGPAPTPQNQDENGHYCCEGTFKMNCCCPKLMTRTMGIPLPADTIANTQGTILTTVNNYEANGYLVFGHSLVDTGAGWLIFLSIGWYQ